MAAKRLIKLLGEPTQNEDNKAAVAITPGQLVSLDGSGNVVPYPTAGGGTPVSIALEREEMGQGIDDDYEVNDKVKVGTFPPGTRFLGIIASGQNIAKEAKLEAGAVAGTFRVFASGVILAKALEAVNNSAGPTTARIRLEAM